MRSEEIKKGRAVEPDAAAEKEGPDWRWYGIASAICWLGARAIGGLIFDEERDRR